MIPLQGIPLLLRRRILLLILFAPAVLAAQPRTALPAAPPIPDAATLMNQVRAHQKQMEALQENYTFRETDLTQILNKDGSVKKTSSEEYEIFYVNTHEVRRLIGKDGHALDPSQQQKEQDRVMKEVEKAQKTPPGQAPAGEVVISVGRLLAVAKVSNPRRVILDGRPTLAFDYAGDPHAKAHDMAEKAARKVSGTIWIDEQDREVRRMTALLNSTFRAGFGLVSLGRGSNLVFDQKLVNNELWLPTSADLYINAHAFGILGARAKIHVTDNGYKKFHAQAIQQPGATVIAQP